MPSQPENTDGASREHGSFLLNVLKSLPGGAIAGGASSWWLARRKARTDAVTAITDLEGELISEVHLYWTRQARDESIENNIVRLNRKLVAKIKSHVKRYGGSKNDAEVKTSIVKLNAYLTSSPFGSADWQRTPSRSVLAEAKLNALVKLVR